jgi:biopolymer transport protein ExbB
MGLLGTVLGMISTFQVIESAGGQADVSALAGGIWVALLTTAFGLVVAIPVVAVYHYFENTAGKRADEMQYLISELNEMLDVRTSGDKSAGVRTAGKEVADYEAVHSS